MIIIGPSLHLSIWTLFMMGGRSLWNALRTGSQAGAATLGRSCSPELWSVRGTCPDAAVPDLCSSANMVQNVVIEAEAVAERCTEAAPAMDDTRRCGGQAAEERGLPFLAASRQVMQTSRSWPRNIIGCLSASSPLSKASTGVQKQGFHSTPAVSAKQKKVRPCFHYLAQPRSPDATKKRSLHYLRRSCMSSCPMAVLLLLVAHDFNNCCLHCFPDNRWIRANRRQEEKGLYTQRQAACVLLVQSCSCARMLLLLC